MTEDMSTNRPLVTFAVFAFNQEQYIREAVEGAFAQTYEPLEIILSDDCSTDRTFEIMKEMAEAYAGSHNIRLNKNATNLNIGGHVAKIGDIASGEIIIMAAGDDISVSNRAEEHAKVYEKMPRATAVFSDAYTLSGNGIGKKLKTWYSTKLEAIPKKELVLGGGGVGPGATYSYRKQCLSVPYSYPTFYHSEDRLLPLRASLIGEVFYLPKILIKYRIIASSVGNDKRYQPARTRADYQEELARTITAAKEMRLIEAGEANKLIQIVMNNPSFWKTNLSLRNKGGRFRILSVWQRFRNNPIGKTRSLLFKLLSFRK